MLNTVLLWYVNSDRRTHHLAPLKVTPRRCTADNLALPQEGQEAPESTEAQTEQLFERTVFERRKCRNKPDATVKRQVGFGNQKQNPKPAPTATRFTPMWTNSTLSRSGPMPVRKTVTVWYHADIRHAPT